MSEADKQHITIRKGRNVFDAGPRISVVIPAYNAADTIGEVLDSVAAQKFREYEVIVVNDGSPDTERLERAINLQIENIIYIRQHNAGAGAARNAAIRHARGEVVAFLDADDAWLPDFLAAQYVYMQRHGLDMVYCDALLTGTGTAYRRTFMEDSPSAGEADLDALLSLRCNVITSGTMARRQAIVDAGMFSEKRIAAEDFDLWVRLAACGARIGYQRRQLVKYHVHNAGLSGDAVARVERSIEAFERVRDTVTLTDALRALVEERIASFESDLAIEQGKALLLSGDHRAAAVAFRVANRHHRSLKLMVATMLSRIAPGLLLHYLRR